VIVERQDRTAFGTAKPSIAPMAKQDADALVLCIEDHFVNSPRSFQRQQLYEDMTVPHGEQ